MRSSRSSLIRIILCIEAILHQVLLSQAFNLFSIRPKHFCNLRTAKVNFLPVAWGNPDKMKALNAEHPNINFMQPAA